MHKNEYPIIRIVYNLSGPMKDCLFFLIYTADQNPTLNKLANTCPITAALYWQVHVVYGRYFWKAGK